MSKRQILLLSSSQFHGYEYLKYAEKDITQLLSKNKVKHLLFIPYALKNHDAYLTKVSKPFNEWHVNVTGIHQSDNPVKAVQQAEAIFIGGGNTFRLLKALYDNQLIGPIRNRILEDGIPYLGASAGANIATKSIHTTNDMPIVYPPSFDALHLIPININPHYVDPEPDSKHKGETREQRILEFQEEAHAGDVLAIREGSSLLIDGDKMTLKGFTNARLFVKNQEAKEFPVGSDLSFLL